MRRLAPSIAGILLVCALLGGAYSTVWAQTSRTAPLPVTSVARTRLFQKQRDDLPPPKTEPKSPIPLTPPAQPVPQPQPQPLPPPALALATPVDPVQAQILAQVKRAIEINKRRMLNANPGGHTPWMIMHGVLALRQEYQLQIGNQRINGLDYITQQNPIYVGSLPDPLQPPGAPWVNIREHWFQSTAYGGRAQPYIVSFAFEGHTNQFLAILSMADLPLTQTFLVADSQRPGATKTITMADMVRHAKMNVHVGNPNEIAWTLWFLSNYLQPDEKWVDKDGKPWSMEQLVTVQTNAPLFSGGKLLAPCGGTHGLFALACACNSYQQKHGQLDGAWLAAQAKLKERMAQARSMQNPDGSFSTEFFKTTGYSDKMGPRFKSSGHMLEWLMMALPPEQLQEQWVRAGVMNVANDLVGNKDVGLGTADTGAMYHALHAMVLYRNRIEPPASTVPPERVAQVPPELKNPTPVPVPPQPLLVPPVPTPLNPAPMPPMPPATDKSIDPQMPANDSPEATMRLLNPATNKLMPLGTARPLLRPITNPKITDAPPKPAEIPAPPPMAERLVEPQSGEPARIPLLSPAQPLLEKPAPLVKPMPAPSEPKSEGAVVQPLTKAEGDATPLPLFGDDPGEMKDKPAASGEPITPDSGTPAPVSAPPPQKPAIKKPPAEVKPPAPAPLVPPLPEPTPAQSPSSSD